MSDRAEIADPPAAPGAAITPLADLYRELMPVVFGFCRARLPLHDAEDVTAEVFHAAAERRQADPAAELNRSWFITTAQNRIIDRWRKGSRWTSRLVLVAASQPPSSSTGPSDDCAEVLEALDRLSTMHRAVLLLHHVDGHPVTEVAEMIGRGPRAVESLLVRARRSLSVELDRVRLADSASSATQTMGAIDG